MMAVGIAGKRCPSLELTSAFARHLLARAEFAVAPPAVATNSQRGIGRKLRSIYSVRRNSFSCDRRVVMSAAILVFGAATLCQERCRGFVRGSVLSVSASCLFKKRVELIYRSSCGRGGILNGTVFDNRLGCSRSHFFNAFSRVACG